jgi:hypothetical protein
MTFYIDFYFPQKSFKVTWKNTEIPVFSDQNHKVIDLCFPCSQINVLEICFELMIPGSYSTMFDEVVA